MEELRAQLEPLWLTDLRTDDSLSNVQVVHEPDRALSVTMLCCDRTVGVDEHAGGFDEMPGRPSWKTLARVLRWRIAGHECGERTDREW